MSIFYLGPHSWAKTTFLLRIAQGSTLRSIATSWNTWIEMISVFIWFSLSIQFFDSILPNLKIHGTLNLTLTETMEIFTPTLGCIVCRESIRLACTMSVCQVSGRIALANRASLCLLPCTHQTFGLTDCSSAQIGRNQQWSSDVLTHHHYSL